MNKNNTKAIDIAFKMNSIAFKMNTNEPKINLML
jgi:hypothetical protein